MPANYYKHGQWNVICSGCVEEKNINQFYIHSNGQPRKQCKRCVLDRRCRPAPDPARQAKYREANYELCLQRTRQWRKNHLEYDAFRTATRRAYKLKQTPLWANLDKIKTIYINCPKGFHVDHIIPLKGKLVRGLHVETNLQYLPATDNLKKRNYYAE